jgi:nucleotide-binding universal stress UspA family protein
MELSRERPHRNDETPSDGRREESPDAPIAALVAAAADADLLVLGSRGLRGLKALGSVSERVAHQAHPLVVVVRDPAWLPGS